MPGPSVRRRASGLALAAALCLIGVWGSVAYACFPSRTFITLQPKAEGQAGGPLTVKGYGLEGASLEIRWNGIQGPQLGSVTGSDFESNVTIPAEARGLNSIVVVGRSEDGTLLNAVSSPVDVIEPGVSRSIEGSGEAGQHGDGRSTVGKPLLVALALVAGVLGGALASMLKRRVSEDAA